jgi:hypothetical protein
MNAENNRDSHNNATGTQNSSNQRRTISQIVSSGPPTVSDPNYRQALHRPIKVNGDDDDKNKYSVGSIRLRSLPYAQPYIPSIRPTEPPPDFSWVTNSCGGKAAIGVIGGGVMGLLMGIFLGAMSDPTPPVQIIGGKEVPQAPLREQMKVSFRATAEKSLYWSRNFAFITGIFGGTDCLVEKYRGKHDGWNSIVSGCVAGAAIQAKAGPQSAAFGCAGFAAFSAAIDAFMGH